MKVEIARKSGGPWMWWGLVALVVFGATVRDGGPLMWPVLALVGAFLLAFRRILVADREAKGISWSWGFMAPLVHDFRSLPGLERIVLRGEDRWVTSGNRKFRTHLFVVSLQDGDGQRVEASAVEDAEEARRLGEALANALRVPLTDGTDRANERTRLPEHLDESVPARLRREGIEVRRPAGPAPRHCRLERRATETVLEFPPRGRAAFPVSYVIVALGTTGAMFGGFHYLVLPGAASISLVVGALAVLATVALGLDACTLQERVTVSPRELVVERSSRLRRSRRAIPAAELEELEASGTRRAAALGRTDGWSVRATTDRVTLEFGGTPSRQEATWVRDTVLADLVRG